MRRTKTSAKFARHLLGVVSLVATLSSLSFDAVAETSPSEKASTVTIGPAFTGHWYDPAQSGHGIFVEILPDNRFLAWWFAFNPEGTQQSWFGGVGTYSGDTATIPDVQIATGGKWIPNFDPGKVVRTTWGSVTFKFSDCNTGRVDFASTYGSYGSNHLDLTRLTMPAGLQCPQFGTTAAKGIWAGATSAGESLFAIVEDDGTYYVLLSQPGNATDARVIQGTSGGANGTFSSSDAVDFPIAQAEETGGTALPASLGGSYVAQSALQLTISTQFGGTRTVSATYVPGSDQSPSLAAAAGSYSGISGHTGGRRKASFTLDASGNLSGTNDAGCRYSATATPRSAQNAFDLTLRATNSSCIFGITGSAISGVMYYDPTTRQIHGFAPYGDRFDEYYLIATKQ